jgi:hypothetical protein
MDVKASRQAAKGQVKRLHGQQRNHLCQEPWPRRNAIFAPSPSHGRAPDPQVPGQQPRRPVRHPVLARWRCQRRRHDFPVLDRARPTERGSSSSPGRRLSRYRVRQPTTVTRDTPTPSATTCSTRHRQPATGSGTAAPAPTARWESESAGRVPHGHLHAAQEPERDDSSYGIIPTQQPYIK